MDAIFDLFPHLLFGYPEITIARVEAGPRAGEWLFSPDTVNRARGFYERVREFPYQRPVPTEDLSRASQH